MQNHLNLIYREEEREMLPLCREEKIGVIPYSPLASGRLTRDWSSETTLRSETDRIAKGKYGSTYETDQHVVARVAELAEKHEVPRAHISIAWLLQKEPVTAPIIGATKISHLEESVNALSVKLTQDEVAYSRRTICAASHHWSSIKKYVYQKHAQHRLHLTAFGAGMRRPIARKSDFTQACSVQIGGR